MKFSILVPVYNVEQYLEQCVDSLLDQTYKGNYEIILVDDGSTDSSGKICDSYAKKHPHKVKVIHKKNGGHTSARREAINNATGEYSLFCDSDDFIETNLLESVDSILNDSHDTDMVMYSFCYYENGTKIPRKISVFEEIEAFEGNKKIKLYDLLITTPYINSLCTKTIKTEILKACRIDYTELKDKDIAEDAYTVTHLITDCKKIININKPLYNYRTNQASISRSVSVNKLERKSTLFLYNRLKTLLPVWGIDGEEYRQKLSARWLDEVMYIFRRYYENAAVQDRKAILNFDWGSMLPEEAKADTNNPYENKVNRKVYGWLTNKKFFKIRLYFFKKTASKFIKNLLKRGK